MRLSTVASLFLLAASQSAHAVSLGYERRQSIQCPPVDKDGTALTGSAPQDDFVTCTYVGAGLCAYFPADGSFSSGSSECPKGIPQDPSATTDAPSTDGSAPTSTVGDDDDSTSDPDSVSTAGVSIPSNPALSTPQISEPGTSTPAVSTPAPTSSSNLAGAPAGSTPVSGSPSASPSPSGKTGGAGALNVPLGSVTLLGAIGVGMMLF